jgi:hypothetical protein
MVIKSPSNRLLLGPIVGHTDHESTRIWIRVPDDPANYALRVTGRGVFPFKSTEVIREFGTAIAIAAGLRPDWQYKYQVLNRRRIVPGAQGTFRTMPLPGSPADLLLVSISCCDPDAQGAWPQLADYIEKAKPRFLIMMGDQVYVDGSDPDVFRKYQAATPDKRRRALVEKYQVTWSREPIRRVLANIPTYMMCDDHEFRDGWGSIAPDSPTLRPLYPRGAKIAKQYATFFDDARDVYWHFQACHNPPSYVLNAPPRGARRAIPFAFQCGRLGVLVLDGRGQRDLWRASNPVLGDEQWKFIGEMLDKLPADMDALAVVTPCPIASVSPTGLLQSTYGHREDDIEWFETGNAKAFDDLFYNQDSGFGQKVLAGFDGLITRLTHGVVTPESTKFKLDQIGGARDQWSHPFCRPEQERLIRAVGNAASSNRPSTEPRRVVFIGGDIHAGALFDITVSDPDLTAQCLVSSGISRRNEEGTVGFLVDEDFEIAEGIRAKLNNFVPDYNFGVTHVMFGAGTLSINNTIAHAGETGYLTLEARLP